MTTSLKRGTRITYRHAGGKVVSGVIVKCLDGQCDRLGWYACELTDEHGTFKAGCHRDQIVVTDERASYREAA